MWNKARAQWGMRVNKIAKWKSWSWKIESEIKKKINQDGIKIGKMTGKLTSDSIATYCPKY